MFDDHPIGNVPPQGQIPPNLPLGEPEDVFAGTDETPATPAVAPSTYEAPVQPEVEETPSALEAGILKPKLAETPRVEPPKPVVAPEVNYSSIHTMPDDPSLQTLPREVYPVKEPTLSRGLMTSIIIILAVLIFGGGGWWVYKSFIAKSQVSQTGTAENENTNEVTPVVPGTTSDTVTPVDTSDPSGEDDSQILFGQPLDSDSDGLSNDDEVNYGTSPENWDTDSDGLSDGDEVIIWKTNPKNPDTDGDTYQDGAEIKSGYSPTGPGRMYEPPTTTPTVVTSTSVTSS